MFKRRLLLAAQVLLYITVIWFIVRRFNYLVDSVNTETLSQKPLQLILSALCFLGFYALLSWHWKRLCDKYTKFPQHQQWLAFFASQPYKYLPSSIFAFSSRAVYAKKLGLPIKQSSLIQLIENLNILFGAACVATIFLAYQISALAGIGVTLLLLLGLGIAVFIPEIKIPKSAIKLSGREWASYFVLPLSAWVVAGIGFYLMVNANGQSISLATAIAANSIAVGLGIVAVFAPGGIGVREFIYSKFSITNSGIIMWRLLTLFIDVIVGVSAILIINHKQKALTKTPAELKQN